MLQLSDRPIKRFSLKDSSIENIVSENLETLTPLPGASLITPEKFQEMIKVLLFCVVIILDLNLQFVKQSLII